MAQTKFEDISSYTILNELKEALSTRDHPYITPVIATQSSRGYGANSRTVILRKVDLEPPALEFHTNVRAEKVAELRSSPHISWTFYDHSEGIQLRIYTDAILHNQNSKAKDAWNELHPGSKKIYTIQKTPGSIITHPEQPLPSYFSSKDLTHEMVEEGYTQFCCVTCPVKEIDWLKIERTRHLRRKFSWQQETGTFTSNWVTP